ncbi:MAG: LemA family protein [Elusimicrobiota bacterium]
MGWVLLIVLVLVVLYLVSIYNKLIRYRVEAENSWSQIDVQLKRRHDLIPNLVETVKGYMQFEKETLTKVMEARAKAVGSSNMQSRLKAEGEISGLLGRLFAVWENYPDLKANKNAMQLQEELTTTENRIAYSRGHYNDIVANYNAMLQQFPSNQVAKLFGPFEKKIFFEIPEAEKEVPKVKF